jgi:hypothetical protein
MEYLTSNPCSYLAPFSKRIRVTPGLPSRQLKCRGVQPRLALDLNIDSKLRVGMTAFYIETLFPFPVMLSNCMRQKLRRLSPFSFLSTPFPKILFQSSPA